MAWPIMIHGSVAILEVKVDTVHLLDDGLEVRRTID
jgi:hypothetical protein